MKKKSDPQQQISVLLQMFDAQHVASLIKHFSDAVNAFADESWEMCILKSGKFIEATIKAVSKHAGIAVPTGRKFKVDELIRQLEKLDRHVLDDALRLVIPRASRFIYDIASNRGARHDPDEIDPNKMDAAVSIQVVSWILAELVRYSQKGNLNPEEAEKVVDALMERKYPIFEKIGEAIYVNKNGLSAREVALLILYRKYPTRVDPDFLIGMLKKHNFSEKNANVAVARIVGDVDVDEKGHLKLRGPGRQKAAEILARK